MSRRQFIITIVAVIIGSFLGGYTYQHVFSAQDALTGQKQADVTDTVKAKKLELIGADGEVRAVFYLSMHDAPTIIFFDKNGTNRLNLGLAPAGNGGIAINDENFKTIWSAPQSTREQR